ncbi:hypothetical protein BZA77DRAFT_119511 [Pyronema omphalodes]|nr:hypothetical protein BZA77DRAFT_119511 [Pyronema omphalodes]
MATTPSFNEKETNLTHAEIWDDSSLVEAWDDALKEYKKYHSIAAKGEDPEAVIQTTENGVVATADQPTEVEIGDAPAVRAAEPVMEDDSTHKAVLEVEIENVKATDIPSVQTPQMPNPQQAQVEMPPFPFTQPHPAGPAAGFAIGGNDDAMRNLMMAWYWAGYYTGLQEGQQKAQQKL